MCVCRNKLFVSVLRVVAISWPFYIILDCIILSCRSTFLMHIWSVNPYRTAVANRFVLALINSAFLFSFSFHFGFPHGKRRKKIVVCLQFIPRSTNSARNYSLFFASVGSPSGFGLNIFQFQRICEMITMVFVNYHGL